MRASPCSRRTPSPERRISSGVIASLLLARAVELRGARRRELGLVALQAGEDAPSPGAYALAEFFCVRLAVLTELFEPLLGGLHLALTRGRELGLVRLQAFRDATPARLLVPAEFLGVLPAGTFALFRLALSESPRSERGGEHGECGRDDCLPDRHGFLLCGHLPRRHHSPQGLPWDRFRPKNATTSCGARVGERREVLVVDEDQGLGVHAVTQARGLRPVLEHVAEVAAASDAQDLGAPHAVAAVHLGDNVLGADGP